MNTFCYYTNQYCISDESAISTSSPTIPTRRTSEFETNTKFTIEAKTESDGNTI